MATFNQLKKEVEPYRNTLVITELNSVARLVDVEDGEGDFYWVFDDNKNGIHYISCVSGWIPLKDYIEDTKYNRLVRIWNLNHTHKAI